MNKLRIISLIAFAVLLICALAVTSSAKWWDDNPFTDVKSSGWYYDNVRVCKELGMLSGVSDTEFGVNTGMTRAMFVTTLAAASHYDASEYAESVFTDVPEGSWYAAPAAWAADKGITGGTGEGIFSPDALITRQEFVTMLGKYADFAGYDITVSTTDLSGFSDAGEAAEWASGALCWAVEKGIISGIADGEDILLAPKGTATRAQAATMLVKLLYLNPIRTINGNDLADYRIVYGKDTDRADENAEQLAWYIKNSLGVELPVYSDEEAPVGLEILVGKTNREGADEIDAELNAFDDDQKFLCKVMGDKLFIVGTDTDSDDGDHDHKIYNVRGTRNAVFYFADKVPRARRADSHPRRARILRILRQRLFRGGRQRALQLRAGPGHIP